jgi:hypothetical protein
MGIEAMEYDFYPTAMPLYILVRYLLIIVTYYMFCKDYKSIAQTLLLYKQFPEIYQASKFAVNVYVRLFVVLINECVVFWIIVSTDIGNNGGLGLIVNFSSAMLICQLDDYLVDSARVQSLADSFENIELTKENNRPRLMNQDPQGPR